MRILGLLILLGVLLNGQPVPAAESGALRLADLAGEQIRPLQVDGKAKVFLFLTHDCPISNYYSPEIRRIHEAFAKRGVEFLMVYVDPDAKPEQLRRHRREFGLESLPAVHDRRHAVVKSLGATVTPEAAVLLPDGRTAYRGRIDNIYADFGKRRRRPTQTELRDALNAVILKQSVLQPRTEAVGCYIPTLRTATKAP